MYMYNTYNIYMRSSGCANWMCAHGGEAVECAQDGHLIYWHFEAQGDCAEAGSLCQLC